MKSKTRKKTVKHEKLKKPRRPAEGGLFELKDKLGTRLHKLCCNPNCRKPLKNDRRVHCGKHVCFRFYRNAYRKDYDKAAA